MIHQNLREFLIEFCFGFGSGRCSRTGTAFGLQSFLRLALLVQLLVDDQIHHFAGLGIDFLFVNPGIDVRFLSGSYFCSPTGLCFETGTDLCFGFGTGYRFVFGIHGYSEDSAGSYFEFGSDLG